MILQGDSSPVNLTHPNTYLICNLATVRHNRVVSRKLHLWMSKLRPLSPRGGRGAARSRQVQHAPVFIFYFNLLAKGRYSSTTYKEKEKGCADPARTCRTAWRLAASDMPSVTALRSPAGTAKGLRNLAGPTPHDRLWHARHCFAVKVTKTVTIIKPSEITAT